MGSCHCVYSVRHVGLEQRRWGAGRLAIGQRREGVFLVCLRGAELTIYLFKTASTDTGERRWVRCHDTGFRSLISSFGCLMCKLLDPTFALWHICCREKSLAVTSGFVPELEENKWITMTTPARSY